MPHFCGAVLALPDSGVAAAAVTPPPRRRQAVAEAVAHTASSRG